MLSLSLFAVTAGVANAQHCIHRGHCNVQQHHVQQHALVEKIQFLAVEKDPYNVQIVGEEIRAKQQAAVVAAEQRSLLEELQLVRDEIAAIRTAIRGGISVGVRPQPESPPVQPQPQPQPEPVPQGPLPAPGPAPEEQPAATPAPPAARVPLPGRNVKLSDWATTLLATNCASCHNPTKANAGFVMFADDLKTSLLTPGGLILTDQVLYSNEMPKGKPKFTSDQYNRLRAEFEKFSEPIREIARNADK